VSSQPSHANHPTIIRHYVDVLLRWKGTILTVVALGLAAGVGITLSEPPRYASTASVLVGLADAPNNANLRVEPQRVNATQAALARTPEVAKRTLKAAGLTDRTPEELLDASNVAPNESHDLLVFLVTDENRRRAAQLATEYARQFIAYRREIGKGVYARKVGEAFLVAPANRTEQTDPKTVRNMALGLVMGLIGGLLLAFLREALDTRTRSVAEVVAGLNLPLLGLLPKLSRRVRPKGRLAMLTDPNGADTEPFRMLCTNVLLRGADYRARTIMITSSVSGEGKSTTAANLAVALARTGRRVILADLDIRRPSLHRLFELDEGRPGLSDAIRAQVDLDDALAPVAVIPTGDDASTAANDGDDLLRVLPAGSVPANVGDIFAGEEISLLIARLRARADIVLIDGPPLLGTGDGAAIRSEVQALVIVSRVEETRRPMLGELRRVLAMCKAEKLGVVVISTPRQAAYHEWGVVLLPPPAEAAAVYSSNGAVHHFEQS
jgi:succinoglycan biosynthesis transport protein ExoP